MKTSLEQFEKNACSALRTTETTNRFLLAQADKKAEILVQVNGLLTSVLIALSVYIAPTHRWFLLPVVIQLVSSLVVIVTSLLVTRPRYFISNVVTHFVNGQKAGEDPSVAGPQVYWDLLRDTHRQATVLAVKYKRLRLSYHVFMAGLVLSLSTTLVVITVAR